LTQESDATFKSVNHQTSNVAFFIVHFLYRWKALDDPFFIAMMVLVARVSSSNMTVISVAGSPPPSSSLSYPHFPPIWRQDETFVARFLLFARKSLLPFSILQANLTVFIHVSFSYLTSLTSTLLVMTHTSRVYQGPSSTQNNTINGEEERWEPLVLLQTFPEAHPDLLDVTLVVGEKKVEKKANSTLLAANSDFFKASLFGSMSDNGSKRRVSLPDVTTEVMDVLLDHVYAKKEVVWFFADELLWQTLIAADQFLMANLKTRVEKELLRRVNSGEAALACYKKAISCRAHEMRSRILDLISNSPFIKVRDILTANVAGLAEDDFLPLVKIYSKGESAQEKIVLFIDYWLYKANPKPKGGAWKPFLGLIKWNEVPDEVMLSLAQSGRMTKDEWCDITTRNFTSPRRPFPMFQYFLPIIDGHRLL